MRINGTHLLKGAHSIVKVCRCEEVGVPMSLGNLGPCFGDCGEGRVEIPGYCYRHAQPNMTQAAHLHGVHLLLGSIAVKWTLADQVRLGCVKRP